MFRTNSKRGYDVTSAIFYPKEISQEALFKVFMNFLSSGHFRDSQHGKNENFRSHKIADNHFLFNIIFPFSQKYSVLVKY